MRRVQTLATMLAGAGCMAFVGRGPIIRFLVAAGLGIGDVVQAGAMLGGIKARAESRPPTPRNR